MLNLVYNDAHNIRCVINFNISNMPGQCGMRVFHDVEYYGTRSGAICFIGTFIKLMQHPPGIYKSYQKLDYSHLEEAEIIRGNLIMVREQPQVQNNIIHWLRTGRLIMTDRIEPNAKDDGIYQMYLHTKDVFADYWIMPEHVTRNPNYENLHVVYLFGLSAIGKDVISNYKFDTSEEEIEDQDDYYDDYDDEEG